MRMKHNMTRATVIYTVTVWFGEAPNGASIKRFATSFEQKLTDIASYSVDGHHLVKVSFRSTDDVAAFTSVQEALHKLKWGTYTHQITEGMGIHQRLVSPIETSS